MARRVAQNSSGNEDSQDADDDFINYGTDENSSEEGECSADVSDDNFEFDDGYDEDLMGDENDREMLNALTEVEREKELFKRMERREALKARIVIENRLKAANNRKNIKDQFSSGRNRPKRTTTKGGSNSISIIRNKRMKRKLKSDGFENYTSEVIIDEKNYEKLAYKTKNNSYLLENNDYSKNSRKEKYLRGNFEEDSDEEFQDTYQKKSLTPLSTLEEFNKLRISRHKLTLWVHQPFFEHKIPGFLVRFATSNAHSGNPNSQDNQSYQAFEIKEILKSNKPYKFGDFFTNKVLRIQRGQDERVVRMEYVSNQIFTEEEFQSYIEVVTKTNIPLPTLEAVEKKQLDLNYCIHFRPTEQDIDHIIEQKNKFRKTPVNFTTEKRKILAKIEEAIQNDDSILVQRLQDNLQRLDKQLEHIHEQRTKDLDKIRLINERNRRANAAQLEKVLENESQSWGDNNNNNNEINNPFVRRRTNPINMLDRKLHGHFAKKLKQNSPPINNGGDQTVGDKVVTKQPQDPSHNNHHPYDISKDLENLYDFELDISLDIKGKDNCMEP